MMIIGFKGRRGSRPIASVVRDHLACWIDRDLELDLRRNYAVDVLSVAPGRTGLGWPGARDLDEALEIRRGAGVLRVDTLRIADPVSVVGWSCVQSNGASPFQGIDSLFIRQGKIIIQARDWSPAPPAAPG